MTWRTLCIYLLCLASAAWPGGALSCRSPNSPAIEEQLAPGVYHYELHLLQGPWVIHLIEIDLPRAREAGVRLHTVRADPTQGGLARTSDMAAGALAAINGDFFFLGEPVRTAGIQIRRGSLLQPPHRRSAFALTGTGEPLVAVFAFQAGLITAAGESLPLVGINREPAPGTLTFFNSFSQTWLDSVHAEVGFQLQSLGEHSAVNDTVVARVLQVRRRGWPLRLGEDQWLVAAGAGGVGIGSVAAGDTVRLFCLLPPATRRLEEGIGGGPRIVRDGKVSVEYERERLSRSFATNRHPRTAVGYSRDRRVLFLVTVDGRQPGYSVGMSLEELATFMGSRLAVFTRSGTNAYQAVNLDGGGSTTMVVRQQVVNRPSDQTGERPVANALLVMPAKTGLAAGAERDNAVF